MLPFSIKQTDFCCSCFQIELCFPWDTETLAFLLEERQYTTNYLQCFHFFSSFSFFLSLFPPLTPLSSLSVSVLSLCLSHVFRLFSSLFMSFIVLFETILRRLKKQRLLLFELIYFYSGYMGLVSSKCLFNHFDNTAPQNMFLSFFLSWRHCIALSYVP